VPLAPLSLPPHGTDRRTFGSNDGVGGHSNMLRSPSAIRLGRPGGVSSEKRGNPMMKLVVMLAVTILCLAHAAPGRAQVSADFCGDLESIAEGWRNLFPVAVGEATSCPDLCRAWAQSCHGAVSTAKRCTLAILEEIVTVARAQCGTEATAQERAQCHRNFRTQIDALKAEATAQAEMGFSFCADAQQTSDCLATCQSTE
jgi:hypothetical protein